MTKSRDLGDLAQTVAVNLPTSLGTVGQSLVVNSGADGLEFGAGGASVTAVDSLAAMQSISSPSEGDLVLVKGSINKLFVRRGTGSGSGWYLIATVTNEGPSGVSVAFTGGGSTVSGAYLLDNAQTATTATGSADPDPEGATLVWGANASTSTAFSSTLSDGGSAVNITTSADTNTVLATISQSNNVFTITPSSETTAPNGGTFAVTFSVTDGVNSSVDSTTTFNLVFLPDWGTNASETKIVSSDIGDSDSFGWRVSADRDGDVVVVGAPNEGAGSSSVVLRGSAYVFTKAANGTWSQLQKLEPNSTQQYLEFGISVSISKDSNYIAVGAKGYSSNQGAVYIFSRSGATGTFSQQAMVQASDAGNSDQFGSENQINEDGDTLIVGCWGNDDAGSNSGSAYVFSRSGSSWSQQQKFVHPSGDANDRFGWSVAIDNAGDTAVVGCYLDDTSNNNYTDAGSAFVFTRSGSSWSSSSANLTHGTSSVAGDYFGTSVAISGDGQTILVGAQQEDTGTGSTTNEGGGYVFTRGSGNSWSQQTQLTASDAASGDQLGKDSGAHLSENGNVAVLCSPEVGSGGAAYVWTRSGSTWTQKQKMASNDLAAGDKFGNSVNLSGDGKWMIVGASEEEQGGTNAGAAYIFEAS